MNLTRALAFAAAGLASGAVAGAFGVGGGVLFVPILILAFRKRSQEAVAISLATIIPTTAVGALTYYYGLGDDPETALRWDIAGYILLGAVAGAMFIGVPLAARVSSDLLRHLFGVLLVLVGVKMLFAPTLGGGMLQGHFLVVMAGGLVAGTMSGFFGIGGGVVNVPLMVMAFGLVQRVAQGTSLVIATVTALAGVLRTHYSTDTKVDFRAAMCLAPMAMLGSRLGASLAVNSDDKALQQGFGILMILIGTRLVGVIQAIKARRGSATAAETDSD